MYTFKYNGTEYSNFDLDDAIVVQNLLDRGVPQSVIDIAKNNKPKTDIEILTQTVTDLTLQNADLQNQVQTLSQTVAQMQLV